MSATKTTTTPSHSNIFCTALFSLSFDNSTGNKASIIAKLSFVLMFIIADGGPYFSQVLGYI